VSGAQVKDSQVNESDPEASQLTEDNVKVNCCEPSELKRVYFIPAFDPCMFIPKPLHILWGFNGFIGTNPIGVYFINKGNLETPVDSMPIANTNAQMTTPVDRVTTRIDNMTTPNDSTATIIDMVVTSLDSMATSIDNMTTCVFSLKHFVHFFVETFWSLKHFGHLSHSCIKTCHSSVHKPVFSDILTEMT